MRKYLCLLLVMLLSVVANAQTNTLATFNLRQNETLKIGMIVLGGWALLNILIGSFRLMKMCINVDKCVESTKLSTIYCAFIVGNLQKVLYNPISKLQSINSANNIVK